MPNLLAGESLVVPPIRMHWIVFVWSVFWPTLIGVIVLVILNVLLLFVPPSDARVWLSLLDIAVVAAIWYWNWLNWRSAMLTVTDQRVIEERGVFFRTTKQIPLDRVQDLSTSQTLLGRLLDYGSVEIDTAGANPNPVFPYANHPDMLANQVFVLSEQLRRSI